MDEKDILIEQLRAALSWEISTPAFNPAYQAHLEDQRKKDPCFIHPAAKTGKYAHLFVW